uniref:Uncharacterized protein n=1 Tax=Spongospora subterranea TaxID=70186 RepID=A0A0H5QWG6_9EUKA|eukprot:CRZ05976.1 hypothetical protein [Spongospora subterranea]
MADVVDVILLFITNIITALGIWFVPAWWSARIAKQDKDRELWNESRERYYFLLREAAQELLNRLTRLKEIYYREKPHHDPDRMSEDFRELFMLSRNTIPDIHTADPNRLRANLETRQYVQTRMHRYLYLATSTLYIAARYFALVKLTRSHLSCGRHVLTETKAKDLTDRINNVTLALKGPDDIDFGMPTEQQESIGEIMITDGNRVMTQYEFRKRLFDCPGWEQFTSLMTFFITEDDRPNAIKLLPKFNYEIREAVRCHEREGYPWPFIPL